MKRRRRNGIRDRTDRSNNEIVDNELQDWYGRRDSANARAIAEEEAAHQMMRDRGSNAQHTQPAPVQNTANETARNGEPDIGTVNANEGAQRRGRVESVEIRVAWAGAPDQAHNMTMQMVAQALERAAREMEQSELRRSQAGQPRTDRSE